MTMALRPLGKNVDFALKNLKLILAAFEQNASFSSMHLLFIDFSVCMVCNKELPSIM